MGSADRPSIAVIGAGDWGKNLVRNMAELGALHTVCDLNDDRLQELETNPDVALTSDLDQVLDCADIHGVVIATPAVTHGRLVEAALGAHKHVLVEKPLCLSEREGQKLIALGEQHRLTLMVGHLLWYHPAVLKLKELVDRGELGRIQYIYSHRLNMGKLRREENVLWSFAPHDISIILGLTNEMPHTVLAQGGSFLHDRLADTTVSLLNFRSGTRAHIFVSWLHPFKEQRLVVVGDRKMAVFDDTSSWGEKLQLFPNQVDWPGNTPIARRAEAEPIDLAVSEPLRNECRHFIDCIANGNKPRTDGQEGLRVLQVLKACQQALETCAPAVIDVDRVASAFSVHPSAEIDQDVHIGAGTRIWHFCHIMKGARIGRACRLGHNVFVGPGVEIGDGCKIQNNVSIYEGVKLEDDVFCGPSMVFTNVATPRSEVPRKHDLSSTLVRKGATIGANATILCGLTLGEYCFIGAGAVVTKDVRPHSLIVGNPGRHIGWMCACGERLAVELACTRCGITYREQRDYLFRLPEPNCR